MYLYEVSWSWYEDYEPYILLHEKEFSEIEWISIIREALKKAIKQLSSDTYSFISAESIIEHLVKILIEEYGFKEAEFTRTFNLWGYILTDAEDINDEFIDEDIALIIAEHNRKVLKSINGNLKKSK